MFDYADDGERKRRRERKSERERYICCFLNKRREEEEGELGVYNKKKERFDCTKRSVAYKYNCVNSDIYTHSADYKESTRSCAPTLATVGMWDF